MGMESITIFLVIFMKENGKMINAMVKDYIFGRTERNILEIF